MTFTEDDFLPISALQHHVFCRRQCALIHIEGIWAENRLTAEGRALHDRVHVSLSELRDGILIARSLRIHSFQLGLAGQADVVEFQPAPEREAGVIMIENMRGCWHPFPVEYKRGRPKPDHCDMVQLCAQAICLEEMLGAKIDKGAIYYGQPRRRQEVVFSPELRKQTEELAMQLHSFIAEGETPRARYEKKCKSCSLVEICMPRVTGVNKNVGRYLSSITGSNGEEIT